MLCQYSTGMISFFLQICDMHRHRNSYFCRVENVEECEILYLKTFPCKRFSYVNDICSLYENYSVSTFQFGVITHTVGPTVSQLFHFTWNRTFFAQNENFLKLRCFAICFFLLNVLEIKHDMSVFYRNDQIFFTYLFIFWFSDIFFSAHSHTITHNNRNYGCNIFLLNTRTRREAQWIYFAREDASRGFTDKCYGCTHFNIIKNI